MTESDHPRAAGVPTFGRVVDAIRSGEIGLLRGVAIDLVMPEGEPALGEPALVEPALRGAVGGALELVAAALHPIPLPALVDANTGLTFDPDEPGRLASAGSGARDQCTLLGQAQNGVIVSVHVSVTSVRAAGPLLYTARVVGTHGSVVIDLLGSMLEMIGQSGSAVVPVRRYPL